MFALSERRATSEAARWLAKGKDARIVIMGRKAGSAPEHGGIAVACRHFGLPAHPNRIDTLLPLNAGQQERQQVDETPWRAWLDAKKRYAVLLGGSSRSHEFPDEDARQLMAEMTAWAERNKAKLLVVASRRSAPQVDILHSEMDTNSLLYKWQPDDDRNPYGLALRHADALAQEIVGERFEKCRKRVAARPEQRDDLRLAAGLPFFGPELVEHPREVEAVEGASLLGVNRLLKAVGQRDVREQVQSDPPNEADRWDGPKRADRFGKRRLQPEGEQDDARNHRKVQVRVHVSRERRALRPPRLGQPCLGNEHDPVEIRPPQGGGHDDAQQRRRDGAGIERQSRRADPDRHDRLAERDDHDEAVALGEMCRRDAPAAAAPDQAAEVVGRQRDDPECRLCAAVERYRGQGPERHADLARVAVYAYLGELRELGVEVIAVGEDVANVKPGDRCSVEPYMNCQRCYACRRGLTNCCESNQTLGVMCDGGMCERMILPARKLHRSQKLTYEQLALVETLAIGCHAIHRGNPQSDENLLVIGAGSGGLAFALKEWVFVQVASFTWIYGGDTTHPFSSPPWSWIPMIRPAPIITRLKADNT